jgi:hypothetical protein
MKNDPLTVFLLAVFAVFTLLSVVLCMVFVRDSRLLRSYQATLNQVNGRQAAINQLVLDVAEYGKTHPSAEPLLEFAGLKKSNGASSTNK